MPLSSAVATRDAIRGARLVAVGRRTHVPLLSGQASECTRAAVTDYLWPGACPPPTCPADPVDGC